MRLSHPYASVDQHPPLMGRFFANEHGKRPRPRRGGGGDGLGGDPCGRPRLCLRPRRGGGGDGLGGDPCGRPRLCRWKDEVIIAVHPGSGGAHKCWPVPCFAETIKQLWEHSCNVLILIGPADHARWAELQKLLPAPPRSAM